MRILTIGLFCTALLSLSACEPKGPASEIGDHIDEVKDNGALTEPTTPPAPVASEPATSDSVTSESATSETLPSEQSAAEQSTPQQPLRPERALPLESQTNTEQADNQPLREEAADTTTTRPLRTPAYTDQALAPHDAPAAEVIEQQKKQLAEANKAASEEADQKLNEILEEVTSEP